MSEYTLGLDVGSNSVGSAWIDLDSRDITMGVTVFPAGVEERDDKRGAPKNQARRSYRSQRRMTRRRAKRKHQMRRFLLERGWMPMTPEEQKRWLEEDAFNPWRLRSEGLRRELTCLEFGRVLLHMAQRRGAHGFDVDLEDEEAGKIKKAISHTREEMAKAKARTFGQFMAMKFEERRRSVGKRKKQIRMPIRNRKTASGEGTYEFCADRQLIWHEFNQLWEKQKTFGGPLAQQLTDACRKLLDSPEADRTWRYRGILFGQRRTYWNVGSMARCDLEPTDLRCPKVDLYAQEFLVLETVNNIRVIPRGQLKRRLTEDERQRVIRALFHQKTASVATVRRALGIDRGRSKTDYALSLEGDAERGLNTSWFHREIIRDAIGEEAWLRLPSATKDSINAAILKFDPKAERDVRRFENGCRAWWGLNEVQATSLTSAWKARPRVDELLSYSRKAIRNLLPYMREGLTVSEARARFAEDTQDEAQGRRYAFGARSSSKRIRRYRAKHPDLLPPAPNNLTNPVVRKAIHEVRRHIQAYLRRFQCKPTRVVVELAREARQTAQVRNRKLKENRAREKERKAVIDEIRQWLDWDSLSKNQQAKAVKRVLIGREQKWHCAYCDLTITDRQAAEGTELELDHIIPESRGGDSGRSNLVLCHTRCNRGKTNQTPREWLTNEAFAELERRLGHLERENKLKWENLHKDVPSREGFLESQLTDTAHAARQVVAWLEDALYGDETDGKRHVFTTKGRYTAILRGDWRLFPDGQAKNRADHRHHAIDAVIVALSGPERLGQLAEAAERAELAKLHSDVSPRRQPIQPPGGDVESFRQAVMRQYGRIIVAHRPQSRKLTGPLHKDNPLGPIWGHKKLATKRIFPVALTPNHLRVPEGWEHLNKRLAAATKKGAKRRIRSEMLALDDVKPGKSGIVRDRWFRHELRDLLRAHGLDPDSFTPKQIKTLLKQEKELCLASGVPVRRITLLRAPTTAPVPRRRWNPETGALENDSNPRSVRLYETQNNHHIEIRQNRKGRWVGEVVTTFDAARRVRPPKDSGSAPLPAVNRQDNEKGKFIMSLSIGEMVYMLHPQTEEPDYFVVFKIDSPGTIHFTPHWDAGPSKPTDASLARQDVSLPVAKFQKLGPEPGTEPYKVWVSPIGEVKILEHD